jgi:Zn-dependent protease with chaperone function
MNANGWWRGALAGTALGSAGLGAVAATPLLLGADVPAVAVPMICVCAIPPADWGAWLVSLIALGILGLSLSVGLIRLGRQVWRTRQAVAYLRLFARPIDRPLRRRLLQMGLDGRVDLVDLDTPLAFCYGMLHPRILLSAGLVAALAPDQLVALLWHESYHLVHRDPLKVALGRAGAAGFGYLPAVRACYDHYLVEKEVEADAYVCARQGSDESLVGALSALLDRGAGAFLVAEVGAVAGGAEVLETRIGRLLGLEAPPSVPWRAAVLSSLLVIAVLALEGAFLATGSPDGLRHIPLRLLTGC